jgi:hypothetical protein
VRPRRSLSALVPLLLAAPAPAALVAQETSDLGLSRGDRVRVTAPLAALERRTAQFIARRGDTLQLRFGELADTLAIPVSAITRLEVSRGTYRPWVRRGLIGLFAGAALGVASAAMFVEDRQCTGGAITYGCGEEKGYAMAGMGIVGGLVGGAFGASVGARRPVDRWEPVRLSSAGAGGGRGGLATGGARLLVGLRF